MYVVVASTTRRSWLPSAFGTWCRPAWLYTPHHNPHPAVRTEGSLVEDSRHSRRFMP